MLDLLRRCFPDRYAGWQPRLEQMMPMLGDAAGTAGSGAAVAAAPDADPDLGTEDPATPGAAERTEHDGATEHGGSPEPARSSAPSGRRPTRPSPPRRRDTPVA
jgi:hypothetical protein